TCDQVSGICTLDLTKFNFAALGSGPIVLAAQNTAATTTTPFLPSVTINGGSVSVPEPGSVWFAMIALVAFAAMFVRQRKLSSIAV
ncbi:MAG TPA: PEP-CTERM sorting domain-containing protein, partial [Terriglobales bacterium]